MMQRTGWYRPEIFAHVAQAVATVYGMQNEGAPSVRAACAPRTWWLFEPAENYFQTQREVGTDFSPYISPTKSFGL
jgi:hypothetical protein